MQRIRAVGERAGRSWIRVGYALIQTGDADALQVLRQALTL